MSAETGKRWVLVVEGRQTERTAICALVKSVGDFGIVEASSGPEAFQKIGRQQFQLMISDVDLPQMDGAELLESIKSSGIEGAPIRVLMLSDKVSKLDESKVTGPVTFVPKPLVEEEFRKLVLHAMSEGGEKNSAPVRMDVAFINPFIDSTLKVLLATAGIKAEKHSVFLRKGDQITGDISAVIAMNSSKFSGSMALSFEEACFLSVLNGMLGESNTKIDAENSDAVGELCNQIFGGAKKTLNEMGCDIQPAIPSVIFGPNHRIKHLIGGPCLAVKFQTPAGCFVVEAILKAK